MTCLPFTAFGAIGDITTCVAEHPELDEEFIGTARQNAPIAFPSQIVARAKARGACRDAAEEAGLNKRECKIVACVTETPE